MERRAATESDSDRIRTIAEQSFQASYALSPQEIEAIVVSVFEDDDLHSRINDDEQVLLVAEEDGTLAGFAEGRVTEDDQRKITWLHVDPTERGQGVGTELFEHVVSELHEFSTGEIRATVLPQNQEGNEFFERFNFEEAGRSDREIGESTFHMEVYTDADADPSTGESAIPESSEIEVDGETKFVDRDESIPGDEEPLLLVYNEKSSEERYGFYCTNCGTFVDSVDGLGKVVCDNCGNKHNPDEWDASYL